MDCAWERLFVLVKQLNRSFRSENQNFIGLLSQEINIYAPLALSAEV